MHCSFTLLLHFYITWKNWIPIIGWKYYTLLRAVLGDTRWHTTKHGGGIPQSWRLRGIPPPGWVVCHLVSPKLLVMRILSYTLYLWHFMTYQMKKNCGKKLGNTKFWYPPVLWYLMKITKNKWHKIFWMSIIQLNHRFGGEYRIKYFYFPFSTRWLQLKEIVDFSLINVSDFLT